ncbi:MAG: hypothetical protein CV087_15355 [Candidatus Brocadia sp. WS118]|nr:MAG: hypothetical protein CV087_15355 [Candidatus Brocadia sp. WS118]
MELVKVGRKWVFKEVGNGWIFNRKFSTEWKAQVALRVFKKGGRISDYWAEVRKVNDKRTIRVPHNMLEKMNQSLKEINHLTPTCKDINEYSEYLYSNKKDYGVVTVSNINGIFPPKIHDTWHKKAGGRVHIDIGCCGYHLMLDKKWVKDFIEFIKNKRKSPTATK